ncbi:MAG TPA: AAA family ATPase [Syntrophorhabdaceae bacterium]|nr:AAA family ATPase [Syntrophorhabdaceae bacterium]
MSLSMYKEYFDLKENPFSIAPDPHYLYLSEGHREALAHLVYGINSDGGFVLLTGEVGTGKTTVCRCLLDQMPENADIAFILNPKLTVDELLASICDEFGIAYPEGNKSVKVFVSAINDFLLSAHTRGRRAILIIEEAQNLSVDVLEQIRLLTNLETNQRKLLQIIMLGQPELRDMLEKPELRQLSQRITARYHLGPLTREEVSAYVSHRLSIAGYPRGQLFPPPVLKRLIRLSKGIPRLINVICDRALVGAFVEGKERVDKKTLVKAAREVRGRNAPRWFARKAYQAAFVALIVVLCLALAALYLLPGFKLPVTAGARGVAQGETPAIKTDQVTPVTLNRPLSTTGSATRDLAYGVLFSKWQIAYDPKDRRDACEQAKRQGLQCLEETGSLIGLKQMNKPAVLKLIDEKGEYYSAMTSIKADTAIFMVGDETRIVDDKEIAKRWSGDYTLIWRAPAGYTGELKPKSRGPLVLWLDEQLSRLKGQPLKAGRKPVYSDEITKEVKEFQITAGLTPDGIAGAKTIICLTDAMDNGGPQLEKRKGDHPDVLHP